MTPKPHKPAQPAGRPSQTEAHRVAMNAALVLGAAVERAIVDGAASTRAACLDLARCVLAGAAAAELIDAARVSNLRPRPADRLGNADALAQRLTRIHGRFSKGTKEGDAARYLAPATQSGGRPTRDEDIQAFCAHYCHTSRPTVMEAWKKSAAWYEAKKLTRPPVDTFYRIGRKLPEAVKNRGRLTGAELLASKPYSARDVSMFKSNDIWVGDGHGFKAKIQHPIHGAPFQPEITVVLDWVSRKVVGWSVDLAESTVAVSAAFRDAQLRTRARPLIYYTDNGAGQTAKLIDCPIHGTLARQGIAHETGIPGNPRGRGVIERMWQTVLIPLAATYPTFTGQRIDKGTARAAALRVAQDQRAGRVPADLPTWPKFLEDLARAFDTYNSAHAHSSHKGQTPDAVYRARLDPDSLLPELTDADVHALWLPEIRRTPRRGLIQLFNNLYFMPELAGMLAADEAVRVAFDIRNAERVWVSDLAGRFLGVATWNGNQHAAFPVPFVEAKRAERAAGKRRRAQRVMDRADAELCGPADLQALPAIEAARAEPTEGGAVQRPRLRLVPYTPDLFEQDQTPAMPMPAVGAGWRAQLRAIDAEGADPITPQPRTAP